jgi:hypothetical protein
MGAGKRVAHLIGGGEHRLDVILQHKGAADPLNLLTQPIGLLLCIEIVQQEVAVLLELVGCSVR